MTGTVGRPRSAKSHQDILEATLVLFAQHGLTGLSMEAIAERAGVGKATIYRRWSSKEDLIKEALTLFRQDLPLPDTGDLRGDLLAVAQQSQEMFQRHPSVGTLIAKLIGELKSQPDIYRAFYDKLVAPRREQFQVLLERAQARGELRRDLDAAQLVSLIFIALVYGSFFSELIDPDRQHASSPAQAVEWLLSGIGTPHPGA